MKLVDIADLKSAGPKGPYGFESHPRYHLKALVCWWFFLMEDK